ncbi:hypothetical protein BC835DRAFT_1368449 [Cytidiella melzeri]|nr:hypothetical protein BC835DRAFT_1368449 [Cytidiella melzeri]
MVLVDDKKYACETCIKGHRSSTCKHTDRPLYEIKKKGRPVTQCEHCRELRKSKQVHVKCMCGAKELQQSQSEENTTPTPLSTVPPSVFKKKGGKKVPVSAAFPSGLPETLGASVAVSEGSDSELGSELPCICESVGVCNCATPRVSSKRKPKPRKNSHVEQDSDGDSQPRMNQPAALVASAHTAGKRPVLPRPSVPSPDRASPPRSNHSPSGAPQHYRMHPSAFSPYERAYEYTRGAELADELPVSLHGPMPSQATSSDNQFQTGQDPDDIPAFMAAWLTTLQQSGNMDNLDMPVTCDCGPNCSCPGCIIHQNAPNPSHNGPSCVNPQTCSSCMDFSVASSTPDNPAIEEWLRRFSNSGSGFSPFQSPRMQQSTPATPMSMPPSHQLQNFDPSMWPTYALWPSLQNQIPTVPPPEDAVSTCCGGRCQCPAGTCACPTDCCGCCAGCTCPDCTHEDSSMGSGKTLTFAVSGERGACCSGARRAGSQTHLHVDVAYGQQSQPGPSNLSIGRSMSNMEPHSQFDFEGQQLDLRGAYEGWPVSATSMDVPRMSVSRASSTSSRSSHRSRSSQGSRHHRSASPAPNMPVVGTSSCCGNRIVSTDSAGSAPASVSSSNPNLPIPPPFAPSISPNQDHRTFTDSLF